MGIVQTRPGQPLSPPSPLGWALLARSELGEGGPGVSELSLGLLRGTQPDDSSSDGVSWLWGSPLPSSTFVCF